MNRRSPFGPGLPGPRLVPSLPFLPAPTVCSAAKPDPKTWPLGSSQVCCTLQPTVGFTPFRASWNPKIPPARHPGGARVPKPSSQALTLRSVPLPGSSLPSPRSPAFTGKHCPLVVGPIHRVATLNRTSTPRPCSTEESVLVSQRFRHARVDAPMGFGSTRSCLPRVLRGRGQVPARSHPGPKTCGAFPGPESPGKAKFLGFVWLRGPMLSPLPEGRDDRRPGPLAIRRLLRSPVARTFRCRMVFGPLARPEDRTVAPPPDAPRRGSDDSTTAPKNRRHHRSRCTRKCLDSGQPPAPPEGGPDDLQDPSAWF